MGNELKLNSAEEAEVVLIRLTPEEYPIAYANKVKCLMLSGLSKKEAERMAMEPIDLELYYEVGVGLMAVEPGAVEAHKAKMAAKRAEICERYDKKIRQAEAEKKIILCVFDYGLPINNVIYYPHTNTLFFNWNDYGGKITQEEFDDFVNNVDRSQLPEGIKFELK